MVDDTIFTLASAGKKRHRRRPKELLVDQRYEGNGARETELSIGTPYGKCKRQGSEPPNLGLHVPEFSATLCSAQLSLGPHILDASRPPKARHRLCKTASRGPSSHSRTSALFAARLLCTSTGQLHSKRTHAVH